VANDANKTIPLMKLSILVAVSENGVIGRKGELPWHLSADLRRFKRLTMGHTIVMGRKTWESIGRPLPGRRMVVVSRQADYLASGASVVTSLEEAYQSAQDAGEEEVFVIGGAEIYRLALPQADRLYLTRVLAQVEGDTFFPELDLASWKRLESESHLSDAKNDYAYRFEILERT